MSPAPETLFGNIEVRVAEALFFSIASASDSTMKKITASASSNFKIELNFIIS